MSPSFLFLKENLVAEKKGERSGLFNQCKHNIQITTTASNSKIESIYNHIYLWIVFGSLPPNILERALLFGGYVFMNTSAHK
jgi:hypothetical protein